MSGIVIPGDRTTKQPARGYCYNPECRETSDAERFEFTADHDHFACPKCGNDKGPGVGLLVLVHLLVPCDNGPIVGSRQRWALVCNEDRAYLATSSNMEAASCVLAAVNCPGCLAEAQRAMAEAVAAT